MIDIDKYEGHTPAPWTIDIHKVGEDTSAIVIESNMTTHSNCVLAEVEVENKYAEADARLIADAPWLLAEVKRLRRELRKAKHWVKDYFTDTNGDYKSIGDKMSYHDYMQEMERIE